MKCSNCANFTMYKHSTNEGHCSANPPIPIRWREVAESPTVKVTEVIQFGPSRTYGELRCGLWETKEEGGGK